MSECSCSKVVQPRIKLITLRVITNGFGFGQNLPSNLHCDQSILLTDFSYNESRTCRRFAVSPSPYPYSRQRTHSYNEVAPSQSDQQWDEISPSVSSDLPRSASSNQSASFAIAGKDLLKDRCPADDLHFFPPVLEITAWNFKRTAFLVVSIIALQNACASIQDSHFMTQATEAFGDDSPNLDDVIGGVFGRRNRSFDGAH